MKAIKAIHCKQCGTEVSIAKMRYDVNGKDVLCPPCHDKKGIGASWKKKEPSGDKISYVCDACRFTFSRSVDQIIRKCPYCDRPTIRPQMSAGDLLRNVSDDF